MLLGSPGARQAQSHTLRPKASGEDLRSAGPKRERKEGWGGAVRPPPLLRPLPAEATRRNLPPGVRALELAHPLPALGKEACADFFKCQTIRKKAGWRLLPTTEKLQHKDGN